MEEWIIKISELAEMTKLTYLVKKMKTKTFLKE